MSPANAMKRSQKINALRQNARNKNEAQKTVKRFQKVKESQPITRRRHENTRKKFQELLKQRKRKHKEKACRKYRLNLPRSPSVTQFNKPTWHLRNCRTLDLLCKLRFLATLNNGVPVTVRFLSQTWFPSVSIVFYNKLSWFVSELPETDISNVVVQCR